MEDPVKLTKALFFVSMIFFVASCSKLIEKTIENNPEILYNAIKKDPVKFMDTLREAAQEAQKGDYERAQKKEEEDRKKEFENPKAFAMEADRPFKGPADAKVTVVEYSDFQCPYCKRGAETMDEVVKAYGDKVRIVFKHLPLESKHPNARRGSEYFEAIAMQDANKAFEFKKKVFEDQNGTYGSDKDADKFYQKAAKEAGADMGRLAADLKGKADFIKKRIDGDMEEANKNGIEGTPGFLINGVTLKGAYPFPEFKKIIDEWLKRKG
jgi:protein-disulfide isomerase